MGEVREPSGLKGGPREGTGRTGTASGVAGRWTIHQVAGDASGVVDWFDEGQPVPVVPSDDAAVQRVARALYMDARRCSGFEMPPWSGASNARKLVWEDRAVLALQAAATHPSKGA